VRRGGRLYWRRVRERERAASRAPVDWPNEHDYDRDDIMAKIDSMSMGWRMLINEHGFTPVMKARDYTTDIRVAERMMNERRRQRQDELANARY
jgi:hypothetical protein